MKRPIAPAASTPQMHHPGPGQGQGHVPLAEDADGSSNSNVDIMPNGPPLREIWQGKSVENTKQHEPKSCDTEGSKDAPGAVETQVQKQESESTGPGARGSHVINMGPIVETSALQFADIAMRSGFVRKVKRPIAPAPSALQMHHPGPGQGQGHVPLAEDPIGSNINVDIIPYGPSLREMWQRKSVENTKQHEPRILRSCDTEGSKDAPGAVEPQVHKQEAESLGGAHVIDMGPIVETSALQFADIAMRNGFVRKVFGIISLQLLLTVGFILVCCLVQPVKLYFNNNLWPGFTGLGLACIVMIAVIFLTARKDKIVWPYDMVALGVFTVVWAFVLGAVSAAYKIEMILLAFGVTAAVVLSIAIFAVNTKIDATTWTSMLVAVGWTVLVLCLAGHFWNVKVWKLVVTGLACMLFSAYIIHDIQLVVGGKHRKYCFNPDDYVLAALIIYIDIINLFLWILSCGGSSGGTSGS